jgi:hypothetical protein
MGVRRMTEDERCKSLPRDDSKESKCKSRNASHFEKGKIGRQRFAELCVVPFVVVVKEGMV